MTTSAPHINGCGPASKAAGVTLIELIGVVSIIAIASALLVPTIAKRIDTAAKNAESTSLDTISDALLRSSLQAKRFPAVNQMPQSIATYLNEKTNGVQANKRQLTRVFLADPTLNINGSGLPYQQTFAGATNPPANVRLMVLSTIAKALPTISSNNFTNIWSTPEGAIPSSLSAWTGRGEDLLIERIELAPLFHRVVLMNVDPAPSIGRYGVDISTNGVFWTNTMPQVPPAPVNNRVAAYFLEGTTFSFYRPDGTLESSEVIRSDVSFVYQNGRWGTKFGVDEDEISDFGQIVDRFLQQPVPCDAQSGATQRSVVNAFYDYLWGYADWAFGDPVAVPPVSPFAGSGLPNTVQYPSYSVVVTAQTHLSGATPSFARNLIE